MITRFKDYGNPGRHHLQYCGKTFVVNGRKYTYLEADFDFVEGVHCSVIRFTDGKKIYTKSEEEFFEKVIM